MPMLKESLPPIEAGDQGRGEVFTRSWVVELILDLCGYRPERDLASLTAIEPSCGSGAFLAPMAARVAESAKIHGRDIAKAVAAIQARDIHKPHVLRSRAVVREALCSSGIEPNRAAILARRWVRQGDFLLEPPVERSADFVLGNPPYVRLEAIPVAISNAYRQACPAMGGRADVYIGFYERGLHALRDDGALGFICADRWMRNAYGARLRELIAREWSVEAILSMTEVDAFESEVDAYPAVTVLRRAAQDRGPLVVDTTPEFGADDARRLIQATKRRKTSITSGRFRAARLSRWTADPSGWPTGSPRQLAAITKIEATHPPLEDRETGTKVGIGLATGADRIFITQDPHPVEPERTLPLAMVRDIASGKLDWSGHYLLNPWDENGLVDLREWPALRTYLTRHKPALAKRHTARSGRWHKTIDRVVDGLHSKEKLYLPDFKGALFPVLDRGESYPHHNLYWITSEKWDLELLGGILLSKVANLFIDSYSVRMRGGYLRFQAQYLRKIRVPNPDDVDRSSAAILRNAFRAHDQAAATAAAMPLYGLDSLPG
jgi:adenine-specific DNA-methyltransferase